MRSWITGTISRYRWPLALLIILQLACGMLVALQPRYYQQLVSLAINGQYANLWASGLPLLKQLALIFLAIALLQGISGYTGTAFSFNLLKQLQTDFFDKASHLPLPYFQTQSAGEFFTKFTNDIGQAQRFFADILPGVGRELITAVAVMVILFYSCPPSLTIAALGIVVITAIIVTVLNRIMGVYALGSAGRLERNTAGLRRNHSRDRHSQGTGCREAASSTIPEVYHRTKEAFCTSRGGALGVFPGD